MKAKIIVVLFLAALMIAPIFSGCVSTKRRVLVIDCPTDKPEEQNKEGFKNETKRKKSLKKINKERDKERK